MKCNILALLPLMHWKITVKGEIWSAMNSDLLKGTNIFAGTWISGVIAVLTLPPSMFPLISSCSVIVVSLWSAAFPLSAIALCFSCGRNAEFRTHLPKTNRKKHLHTNGSEMRELFFFSTEFFGAIALPGIFSLLGFPSKASRKESICTEIRRVWQ